MAFDSPATELAFSIGRTLFAGAILYTSIDHFTNTDDMAGYAEAKGVPAPRVAVLLSGGALVVGALSILLGAYPAVGAGALVAFFVLVTPTIHDYWSIDDPEARRTEQIHFVKNVGLLGASLVFFSLATEAWPYALDLRL